MTKFLLVLAALLIAAAVATAQSGDCTGTYIHGKYITPNDWAPLVDQFTTNGQNAWWAVDLCNRDRFTAAPAPATHTNGYVVASTQSPMSFNQRYEMRYESSVLYFNFGSTRSSQNMARVVVHCNMHAKALRQKHASIEVFNNTRDNKMEYRLDLEIDQLCVNYTQAPTAAPATTLPTTPWTSWHPYTSPAPDQGNCEKFWFNGHEINPNNWDWQSFHLRLAGSADSEAWWGVDLCSRRQITSTDFRFAYVVVIPNAGSHQPKLTMNQRLFREVYSDEVVFHYGSDYQAGNYVHVHLKCLKGAHQLKEMNKTVSYWNHSDGTRTYDIHLGIDSLCVPTTAAPMTTAHPTMAPGQTTAAPPPLPLDCLPFDFNGREVRPGNWPRIRGSLNVTGLRDTEAHWDVDLCHMIHGNTHRVGYALVTPYAISQMPKLDFDWKLFKEVSAAGVTWHMGQSIAGGYNFLHVHVSCGRTRKHELRFLRHEATYFNHTGDNSRTYRIYLETSDLCPHFTHPTNPDAGHCKPFWITPVVSVDPKIFTPVTGSLKDIMTGVSVDWSLSLCKIQLPPPPPPGHLPPPAAYLASMPNPGEAFPQVSFDVFERATYFKELGEYRVRYKSDQFNHTTDRAEVVVRCGRTRALRWAQHYFFTFTNSEGGKTYQFSASTRYMCTAQTSTALPPTFPPFTWKPPVTSPATTKAPVNEKKD